MNVETTNRILKNSPWGRVQHATILAPGIVSVSTSSHGGIHLDRAHQAALVRRFSSAWSEKPCGRFCEPWYEEDCDWCIPWLMFDGEILAHLRATGQSWELDHFDANSTAALKTWRNWIPDAYEEFFEVKLTAADSYKRRESVGVA